MSFTTIDYLVLFVYLLVSALFGAFLGKGQKNLDDYFLASKKMPWWTICLSIVATETSTLTFIGAPAIAFTGNLTFIQVVFGYFLGRLLVSFFLIPGYFTRNIQTAYELLYFRFGARVRDFSALLFLTSRSLADGVRLFATSLVLSVVTDLTDIWTILIIGGVTIIYTLYGGMRAVIWNDVIQLGIYLLGALLAFLIILNRVPGGWSEIAAIAARDNKFQLLNFSLDLNITYTLWAGLLGGAFLTLATHGTDQMMVQRYLACGSRRHSQLALVLSGFIVLVQFLFFLLIGVMLYAFYEHFPLGRDLSQVNQIFPVFIVEQMPAGISGFVVAAIFAASMSTLSSSLNSLASSSVNDFYRPYLASDTVDTQSLNISRLCTFGWGVILMSIAMWARDWGELLQAALTITGATMGCVLGVFLLGLRNNQLSQRRTITAMVAGLVAMTAVHLNGNIAWTWYVLIGAGVTYGMGFKSSNSKL